MKREYRYVDKKYIFLQSFLIRKIKDLIFKVKTLTLLRLNS